MAPPKFDDLGKDAKDVFDKGYGYGSIKLDAKTKAANGMEFKMVGSSNNDTGKVSGNIETKYAFSDNGITFTEKWTTDNLLTTDITIEDLWAKGLKLTFDTMYAPNTGETSGRLLTAYRYKRFTSMGKFKIDYCGPGEEKPLCWKKSAKIKSAYKHDYVHATADVDFDFAGPTVQGSAVFGYEGFLAGCQAAYDTAQSKLITNNISLGYQAKDFTIHSAINDASKFMGSLHHKINDKLTAGAHLNWESGSSISGIQFGCIYDIDKDSSFRVKVNNNSHVGLGYTQTLRPGVKVTLASLFDTKNLNQGGHKVGLGLNLEA